MSISPQVGPGSVTITAPTQADPLRQRVAIEAVRPQLDGGRFAIKRTVGETVQVTAHVFADGHDRLAAVVKHRHTSDVAPNTANSAWLEVPLTALGNDEWTASFTVTKLGIHEYTVEAWIDRFGSWLAELVTKSDAGVDVASELLEGAALVESAAGLKEGAVREDDDMWLLERANQLKSGRPQQDRVTMARDPQLARLMAARPDRSSSTVFAPTLRVIVDPVLARFGAWYEFFPRSCTSDPARPGTLRDAEGRLPALADMGFDVVYLPPIHPIGLTNRKGRNNALVAAPGDPGSPWAIGSPAGGHTAVDPGLGTLDDFDRFVGIANRLGMEVALDIAFQASPDHPWVHEHPEWFKRRPDGSIKFAENPPKKYQDIYPLDLGCRDRESLWAALRDVFLFWLSHGVRTFRVDNPHTKPFRFWQWCIADITRDHPEVIFLAEAFTRPKVMQHLAKLGFNQSYTYFTWRNSAAELREYLTELTATDVREYMRPNFFANTPDILHEYLQRGGRPAFEVRLILAATLSASYGIYSGFELCEHVAVRPGSEEYLDSEKYQIKVRDWHAPGNLTELIARVNAIRREQPALQQNATLRFHDSDNPAFLWFSKHADGAAPVFVVANTDPAWMQHGWVEMPLGLAGLTADATYEVEDLLDGARYTWHGARNYVRLAPAERVAHIFAVRR
ncbi:MAG TPA: alpha-1,4-glucan--maltose-1-phosphate maltosyltransferase [Vicinamibacterales bacterium]|nr:alpha-1,4-glucan--maltose-1-phosphate maltosyltransferase [Vicinamibacterales bacterium]